MRVIAGKYRHINLQAPSGMNVTRPTMDRVKESMFNIIGPFIYDATVLDLFGGSGALGIEAVSRGASKGIINDRDKNALKCIKENIKKLKGEANEFLVLELEYLKALEYLKNQNIKIDILILDPPYKNNIYNEIMDYMFENDMFNETYKIIIEAKLEMDINLDDYNYKMYKYGDKKLINISGRNIDK